MYFVGWYFYGYYYYNHSHQYDKLPSPLLPIYLPMYLPTLFTFLLTYLPYQAAGNEKTKINKKKKMEMTSYGWFFYSFLYWGCNIYTRIPIFFLFYFLVVLFLLHQKKRKNDCHRFITIMTETTKLLSSLCRMCPSFQNSNQDCFCHECCFPTCH